MNSSVLLVSSHHNFYTSNFIDSKDTPNEVIELTEEMLSWPRYGYRGNISAESWSNVYKNALKALLSLPPFDAQVSIWADIEKRHIRTTEQEWGVIYFEDQVVARFSHDTRYNDRPFYRLLEWTEQVDNDKSIEKIKRWTVDQWKDFFYGRIRRDAEDNLSSAKKKIREAEKQKKDAEIILTAIPE